MVPFLDGRSLLPGTEREVQEGVRSIGMTLVAIGESAATLTKPFLESIGLTGEVGQESGFSSSHKDKTNQKKLKRLWVSNVF